jgi:hypothetical protein
MLQKFNFNALTLLRTYNYSIRHLNTILHQQFHLLRSALSNCLHQVTQFHSALYIIYSVSFINIVRAQLSISPNLVPAHPALSFYIHLTRSFAYGTYLYITPNVSYFSHGTFILGWFRFSNINTWTIPAHAPIAIWFSNLILVLFRLLLLSQLDSQILILNYSGLTSIAIRFSNFNLELFRLLLLSQFDSHILILNYSGSCFHR